MNKLSDYSAVFLPHLKFGDFSPEALANITRLYCRLCRALDGFWYLAVKETLGNEKALACDRKVWAMFCKYEMAKITEQLNIQGNDIAALMKALQLEPLFQETKFEIELVNSNNAIFTVTYCPILVALEKEGEGRENEICKTVEPEILKNYASFFDPNIEISCLKLPPRKDRNEICCEWEFRAKIV